MPAITSLLMVLLVVLSVAGLIYTMVRLTRRRARMEVGFTTDIPGQKAFRPPEFYDKEIDEAIRTGDWHAAWLAAWRQFLSRLESCRMVEADRTRTNREYLAQLHAQMLPASADALLTGMVDAYDRFIYGRKVYRRIGLENFFTSKSTRPRCCFTWRTRSRAFRPARRGYEPE